MAELRVRFAPSPTGPLHIGGARTALFNWLLARGSGGTMVMRSEDTDLDRSSAESEQSIMEDLRWLGLDWDEGVDVGGPCGPYRQSERLSLYDEYTRKLLEQGHVYRCYCSDEELEEMRQELLGRGEMPRYTGKCRALEPREEEALAAEGRKAAIRFRVPERQTVTVVDLVRGNVEFDSAGIGDFILVKSDGLPTYNYACVIDDTEMAISHVIRGEEHLSNTPRQVLLYDALGLAAPVFAHISLILAEDRTKMSKRKGDTAIEQYRDKGYLPEALFNFLVLLGWSPTEEREVFPPAELVQLFSLERVSKAPAVFDMDKLRWLNGHYIKHSPLERITRMALPYLQQAGYLETREVDETTWDWLKRVVDAVRGYLAAVGEVTGYVDYFFRDELEYQDAEVQSLLSQEQVPQLLESLEQDLAQAPADLEPQVARKVVRDTGKRLELGGKKVFMPLRAALTGCTRGPELDEIMSILGRDRVIQRLRRARKQLQS